MAIKNNTKKKQLLLERKPLPAKNSISSAKRKQKPSSFRRTIKKKMHLKMKERESARILRRCMVEEATLKSYESCMKKLAEKMADERKLEINVILTDEKTNRN